MGAIDSAAAIEGLGGLYGHGKIEHLRVPPQSIEAEQAVLGGLLLSSNVERAREAWARVSDLLEEASFYRRDHQLIWRALAYLHEKNRPMDAVTVGEFLERHGLAETVANGAYLVELASTTPSAANIRAYAEIVADRHLLRQVIETGTGLVNDAFDSEGRPAVEIAGLAMTKVSKLLQAQPAEVSPMSVAMDAAFAELADRHSRGEGMDGLPTGYGDLDDILGGLVPGVHFLGGRPKHGKSTLAQNIAEYVALELRKPVHIVILEMSETQYAKRMIASVGGVDSQRMRRGTLDEVDWSAVSGAVRKLRGAPMFISKPGSTRIEHVCAQWRKQHAKTPLGLAVLDYLQLVEIVTAKGENYSVAVGRVTRALVNLSQELRIPILCLSQLTRAADEGEPKVSHLRDSGAIEADAESVFFVHREDAHDPKSRFAGTVKVIVAANRNGPTGDCRLLFNGAQYRCENLPDGWEPASLPEGEKPARRGFRKVKPEAAPRADVDG